MAVYQSLSVTQIGQNQDENTSQVRILWQSTQTGGSYNDTQRTARYTIACNGGQAESFTVSYTLPMQATATILDTVVTVSHDSRGEGDITVTTWMNTNISAGVVELSQKLLLDTIPQAGTLRATEAYIGGVSKIAITRKNSEHTHSIFYRFGELSGYVDEAGRVQSQEVRFSQDSVDFAVPTEFYGQIPNEKWGVCQLFLYTYLGDTLVGQPQTAEFTATAEESVCRPEVTGQVVDVNGDTVALTGSDRIFIPYASQALCTMVATAQNSATIVRQEINGQPVTEGLLLDPQADSVSFLAEDSRGYITRQTVALEKVPYQKPSFDVGIARTDPVAGRAVLSVSGRYFAGDFGAVENSLALSYSLDGAERIAIGEVVCSGELFEATAMLEDMAYDRVYTVTVQVADALFSIQKQAVLKKTVPVFDWGEQDFAFHVPVMMDTPLSLQNGGTGKGVWQENGVVMKDDTGLTAIPAGAGAFYGSDGTAKFGILPIAQGGTGGADAQSACENLGLVIPMALDTEYATNHRWLGQTVYTKILYYGNLPNTSSKGVPHGAQASQVLACRGTASNGRTLPWGGIHVYRADLFCDKDNIFIDTEYDYSGQTATVQIWYVK